MEAPKTIVSDAASIIFYCLGLPTNKWWTKKKFNCLKIFYADNT